MLLTPAMNTLGFLLPLVTVYFRRPDGKKNRVRFIAGFTLKGWVGGVHPDVLFLRSRVNLN
jgi:hypothetical protein